LPASYVPFDPAFKPPELYANKASFRQFRFKANEGGGGIFCPILRDQESKMKSPIVIIGVGELGGVFAKAFLRGGHPVYPVTRELTSSDVAHEVPDPQLAMVAVAETDFHDVMSAIPDQWRDKLVLIQNELLPRDWEPYDIASPTVMSVWFEKKRGMDCNPLLPSPIYGPGAELIADSLAGIDIPCKVLNSEDELVYELVLKNVFVFTINIAGLILAEGVTTSTLWQIHQQLARAVAGDIIDVQEHLTGKTFSRDQLIKGLIAGIEGDPNHKCKGRSAPGRLQRLLEIANGADLKIPSIRDIHRRLNIKDL
jgi:hypothetical protein